MFHLQEYIEGWLSRPGDPGDEDGSNINDEHEDDENVIYDYNFDDYDYQNKYDGIIEEPVVTDDNVVGKMKTT